MGGQVARRLVVVALALAFLALPEHSSHQWQRFLTRDGALEQETRVKSAKAWDGSVVGDPPPEWVRMLSAAPDQKIRFENADGAPIVITDANVKAMKFDGFYALRGRIAMEGAIERAVQVARIQYWNRKSGKAMNIETATPDIRRGQTASLNKVWFLVPEDSGLLDDYENQLAVKITGARFADVSLVEKLLRKLDPSLSYMKKVSAGLPDDVDPANLSPAFKARFEHIPGAPVLITIAGVKIDGLLGSEGLIEGAGYVNTSLQWHLSLANQSDRRVTYCAFEIRHPEFPVGSIDVGTFHERILIEPRASLADCEGGLSWGGLGGAKKMADLPVNYSFRVVGVGFEDGSCWIAAGESTGGIGGCRGRVVNPATRTWLRCRKSPRRHGFCRSRGRCTRPRRGITA